MERGYNGHKNWTYWNVALWLGDDEGFYRLSLDLRNQGMTRTQAAKHILSFLHERGIHKTPDGAVFTEHNIMAGLRGTWEE